MLFYREIYFVSITKSKIVRLITKSAGSFNNKITVKVCELFYFSYTLFNQLHCQLNKLFTKLIRNHRYFSVLSTLLLINFLFKKTSLARVNVWIWSATNENWQVLKQRQRINIFVSIDFYTRSLMLYFFIKFSFSRTCHVAIYTLANNKSSLLTFLCIAIF
jgi:hypothetical protein